MRLKRHVQHVLFKIYSDLELFQRLSDFRIRFTAVPEIDKIYNQSDTVHWEMHNEWISILDTLLHWTEKQLP